MKSLLRRLGLLDSLVVEIPISRQTLIDYFSKRLDRDQPDFFDIFTFNKKEFKGFINEEKFTLKRRRYFPDFSTDTLAYAKGKFKEDNQYLTVSVNFVAFYAYCHAIYFCLVTIALFLTLFVITISSIEEANIDGLYGAIFILAFWTFSVGLPISLIRLSVQNFKNDLAQDLKKINGG